MQIKELIRLLENHHKDAEVKCLVKNDGDEYDIGWLKSCFADEIEAKNGGLIKIEFEK